jgi:hypothetical protein
MFDLNPFEQVYTLVDKASGKPTHVASAFLLRTCEAARLPIIRADIGGTLVTALENGELGVEEEHALKLPNEAIHSPLLVLEWNTQDHVIADGAHRLWRRWKAGHTTFRCYLVREEAWRHFEIYDMPGSGEEWDEFNRNAKIRHLMA